MNTNHQARFVYVRQHGNGKPRKNPITVAYLFDDTNKRIIYNTAQCSNRDVFTKAMGRQVSEGRALAHSRKHPNKYIPYEMVSEEGTPANPRYALIAAEIISRVNEGL